MGNVLNALMLKAMEKLPKRSGISLNPEHYKEILDTHPAIAWLDAPCEYYLGLGGAPHYYLEKIAEHYPLAINSRALSIGSAESVDPSTLNDVQRLLEIYKPSQFTELLCWTRWQGKHFNTPMPLPYTWESLDQVSLNIKAIQNTFGRRILIENPANFMCFSPQDCTEGEFFQELVRSTGCGIALNLTHLYISNVNLNKDPFKALAEYPLAAIQQVKLKGQKPLPLDENQIIMVDTANGEVSKPIWRLYRALLHEIPGGVSTSVEWTQNIPSLSYLLDVAEQADDVMFEIHPLQAQGTHG